MNNLEVHEATEEMETLYKGEPIPEGTSHSAKLQEVRIAFIRQMAMCGRAHKAAQNLGYKNAGPFIRWKKVLPKFSEAWDEAEKLYIHILEEEAHRRAVDGVKKDVYFKGEVVGTEMVYSDGLLQTLLKANDPGKYGAKEEGGRGNNIGIVILPMAMNSLEDWEKHAIAMHRDQKVIDVTAQAVTLEPEKPKEAMKISR